MESNREYNQYWETDEFEDLVARSLIGLYETKIKKEKRAPKCIRFDEDVFKRFRNMVKIYIDGEEVEMKYDNIFKSTLEEKKTKCSKTINLPSSVSLEEFLEILEKLRLEEIQKLREQKLNSLGI